MFKISKLTDYATVLLSQMATEQDLLYSATSLAKATKMNVPTVSKILKLLTEAALLHSVRGAQGGYGLAKPAQAISMADIITAIDGTPAVTACCKVHSDCERDPSCGTRPLWQLINMQIMQILKNMTLADIQTQPLHYFKSEERTRGK